MTDFYSRLAKYYDQMYSFIDYQGHSSKLHTIIQQHKKSSGNTLLDVGCGTGTHILHLMDKYQATGLDLSKDMLEVAHEKCGSIDFIQGNMVTMNLGRSFDVVTCLFGSIGYLTTHEDLAKTINAFSKHLVSGGVAIIEPLFTLETARGGSMGILCLDLPEIKIARTNVSRKEGNLVFLDFHFLISTKENGTQHFVDPSPMGAFSKATYLELMQESGLSASFIEPGLTKDCLFIGVKN
ncbi:MAG: class I SAM-dependent DNA methyltransferase [Candidatus Thorarchaeota archaeon]